MAHHGLYAAQVLTDTSRTVGHIIGHVYRGEVNKELQEKEATYKTGVGENWAFGLTDYQVMLFLHQRMAAAHKCTM